MTETTSNLKSLETLAAPVGRLLLSSLFILAGINKIIGYSGTVAYMEAQGVPGVLLPLVIITELFGGLMILFGFKTRLVAFALAGFSVLSAIFFHMNFADQIQLSMFMKNIALGGAFLLLVAMGPGAYSIDNRTA